MSRGYRKILRPRPQRLWLAWLVAAAVLTLTAWICTLAVHEAGEAQRWQVALETAQSHVAHRPVPPVPTRAAEDAKRRWDALAVERAFSWYPLFRALEQASSPDIELLEFLPDKAGRRLTLRGESRNLDALTAYLFALNAQSPLSEVYLAQQKTINRTGMSLLSFEVRARVGDTRH